MLRSGAVVLGAAEGVVVVEAAGCVGAEGSGLASGGGVATGADAALGSVGAAGFTSALVELVLAVAKYTRPESAATPKTAPAAMSA